MILFKPEHVLLILGGNKTQTRRLGKRRWKVGAIHACYTRPPFAKGGADPFCRVRILNVHQEYLHDVVSPDARAEGYDSRGDFIAAFYRINPSTERNPKVWVVTFRLEAA